MKVYLIRDLLTNGIVEAEGHVLTGHPHHIQVNGIKRSSCWRRVFHKGEWFTTKEEAVAAALAELDRREKSLRWDEERIHKTRQQIEDARGVISQEELNNG